MEDDYRCAFIIIVGCFIVGIICILKGALN